MTLKSVVRDRNARLFLGVTVVAGFGSTAMTLVASIWVLSLTGSARLAALCGLCVYRPSLAGPLIGTVVDRLHRQRLLVGTSLALAALLLPLFAVRSAAAVWLVFVVMTGYGISFVVLDAGEAAVVQAVVPGDGLGELNSLRLSVQEGMKLVAPLAGAGLFAWVGAAAVVAAAAVCLVGSAVLYASVHFGQSRTAVAGGMVGQAWHGLRYLFSQAEIRPVVLVASSSVAMVGLTSAANFVVLTQDLHRPPAFAGVLGAAQGLGSILGGMVGGRLLDRLGASGAALAGAVLSAFSVLALSVPVTGAVLAARTLLGVGLPWTLLAAFTIVQLRTDESLIGRVSASASTLIFAPIVLTTAAGAALIGVWDHRLVIVSAAVVMAVAAVGLVGWPRRATAAPETAG